MTADTTPPGDTTTAREALVLALDPLMPTVWAQDIADDLLAGPLSDPAVVAQLPGAAGLVRELDEANELGAVTLAVALALEEARAKLAQVEALAEALAGKYGTYSHTFQCGAAVLRAIREETP